MANYNLYDLKKKFPPHLYNLLIPVTQINDIPSIQKVVINIVIINTDEKTKEIYLDKLSNKYALTKIGLTKLASAANIRYLTTRSLIPQSCTRCSELFKSTCKQPECSKCKNQYDVKVCVSIEVPKTDGSFTEIVSSKELRMEELKSILKPNEYARFFNYRNEQCESRAYNRAIRAALSIRPSYTLQELEKPFAVAHLVPDLDNPDVKKAVLQAYGNSIQTLFTKNIQNKDTKEILNQLDTNENIKNIYLNNVDNNLNNSETTNNAIQSYNTNNTIIDNNNYTETLVCKNCGTKISEKVRDFSISNFKIPLCYKCQHNVGKRENQ